MKYTSIIWPSMFFLFFMLHVGLVRGQVVSNMSRADSFRIHLTRMQKHAEWYSRKMVEINEASLQKVLDVEQILFKRMDILQMGTDFIQPQEEFMRFLEENWIAFGKNSMNTDSKFYIPKLDSMITVARFLMDASRIDRDVKFLRIQDDFSKLQFFKTSILERQKLIESKLASIDKLSADFKRYSRVVAKYKKQVESIQHSFEKPDRLISEAFSVLSERKDFRKYFAKHSILSSLIRLPVEDEPVDLSVIQGLQTRESVEKLLVDRFGSAEVFPTSNGSQNQLPGVQTLLNGFGSLNAEELFDLREGELKYKSGTVKQRSVRQMFRVGFNVQTVKATGIYPTTTDIGVSFGLDITDNFVVGLGAAGKLGLGNSIQSIRLSGQGVSLRSFSDVKLKGNVFASVSAEMHYLTQITKIDQLKDMSAWKFAGMAGLTKKFRVSQKTQGNLQCFYDFFYRNKGVPTSPVVFRFGYTL